MLVEPSLAALTLAEQLGTGSLTLTYQEKARLITGGPALQRLLSPLPLGDAFNSKVWWLRTGLKFLPLC